MVELCEEIMVRLKESAKQCNEVTGLRESGSPEQRDSCVQTMARSETGAVHVQRGWCLVEESISLVMKDRSSDMSNVEYMLATETDDQEQEDVTTGAFTWRCESETVEGAQEKIEEGGNEDRSSGDAAAVCAVPNDMLPDVPQSGGPENRFYRVANGPRVLDLGRSGPCSTPPLRGLLTRPPRSTDVLPSRVFWHSDSTMIWRRGATKCLEDLLSVHRLWSLATTAVVFAILELTAARFFFRMDRMRGSGQASPQVRAMVARPANCAAEASIYVGLPRGSLQHSHGTT